MSGGRRATRRRLLARAAGIAAIASLAAGDLFAAEAPPAGPGGASAPIPPERPRVLPPRLTLVPASSTVVAGESVEFIARATGGEAMLFSIEWSIREGPAGGTLTPAPVRRDDGSQAALYLAPVNASGVIHVLATLHEFPSVQAEAAVEVRRAR